MCSFFGMIVVLWILFLVEVVSARTIVGLEKLKADSYNLLYGHRVAVLTNPTGIFPVNLVHVVDDLHSFAVNSDTAGRLEFVMILGPEHGFRGEKQAETGDSSIYWDNSTGLPVLSAYSMSRGELRDTLLAYNITAILVDMQDVGVRLYTFIWTMYNVMSAFSSIRQVNPHYSDQVFVVCDRPNPNGGILVDGPMLNPAFASGYGWVNIPFLHGMTIGELSLLFNDELSLTDTPPSSGKTLRTIPPLSGLKVVPMQGWTRSMIFSSTGLRWIPPSPNLPTVHSAMTYSATVFLEATTLSEGRGTCTPFTLFGAPFFNSSLADKLNEAFACEGDREACFRGTYFQPTFQKYNNSVVVGVEVLHSGSDFVLRDFRSATTLLKLLKSASTSASDFQWDGSWFGHPGNELVDQYAGTDEFRIMLDNNASVESIVSHFEPDRLKFEESRKSYLLYQ